ncbi:DUF2201 family putative metallopeptidase [Ornithinimicrobium murale]|uniref:vWA domain-containing protein n=1 Tax=Ornithinimicrobium murale TaxID=1050153 RepID=UPI000E0D76F0|nr:VWA-like domain-containing protein [Ornithinimicrobium murale]
MSTTITGARPHKPSPEQLEHLAHWLALALDKMPYFANILYGLRPLHAPGLRTFAVDEGLRLYIDFDAVINEMGWTADQCSQALLHEASHVWRQHLLRGREAGITRTEGKLSNIAADCEINDDLVASGCAWLGEFGVVPSKIGQPDNETFEFYLASLRDQVRKHQQNMCGTCGSPKQQQPDSQNEDQQPGDEDGDQDGGDQDGDASGSQPGDQQDGDRDGDQSGGSGGQPSTACPECGDDSDYSGCGSIGGGTPAPFELPVGDDADGSAPAVNPSEVDGILERTANSIIETAKNRGNVPGGLIEEARQILAPPQVPWYRTLNRVVNRAVAKAMGRKKATYDKRSRRRHNIRMGGAGNKVIYPGQYSPKLRLLFARDTSGSMSVADLNALGNEIVGIAKVMGIKDEYLRVMDVDAQVHAITSYRAASTLTDVHGRGGTDMCEAIRVAVELPNPPDVLVVGTDGFTPWPEAPVSFPVIACIVDQNGSAEQVVANVPDWITTVVVDPSKGRDQAAA